MAVFLHLSRQAWLIALMGFIGVTSSLAQPLQPGQAPTHAKAIKVTAVTKPAWTDLKLEQQTALAPLQSEWLKMSAAQKRKWLEISKNYGKLNADDKVKLQERMRDWVKLSPEQRAQARLNFSSAKTLTPEEKQKQWQAYQALSPEEKHKLQIKANANTPNSAALVAKPQNKIVPIKKPEAKPLTQ
jgi:hypothetical protein